MGRRARFPESLHGHQDPRPDQRESIRPKRRITAVLVQEYASPHSFAEVSLAVHGRTTAGIDSWLAHRLQQVREHPAEACKWLEEGLLRAMSDLNRSCRAHWLAPAASGRR